MAAKLRIFFNQGNYDVAVAPAELGVEDLGGCARRVLFGPGPGPELSERADYLWWGEEPIVRVDEIALPGAHNLQNAMATAAACLARGIEADAVAAGLRTFAGVRHRLEAVAVNDGVTWVNDSKATNVASTIVALAGVRGADPPDRRRARQAPGLLAAGAARRRALPGRVPDRRGRRPSSRTRSRRPVFRCTRPAISSTPSGSRAAPRAAGEVVLLSPACASYDQYPDFEARGDHFRALVAGRLMARAAAATRGAREAGREGSSRTAKRSRSAARRVPPPLEHRILMTATLCLLAFGAVMVYSASSPLGVLSSGGSGTGEFVRYLAFGALGLAAMHVLARRGLQIFTPKLVNALLAVSFVLLLLGAGPGLRRGRQRRPALVRRGPDPVPAVGADEARDRAVRGPLPGRPPQADAELPPGGGADRDPGRPRLPADRRRARPRHDARGGADDRGAAGRRRDADALRRAAGRDRRRVRDPARDRAAVRTGAADVVPAPVGAGHEVGARLPGGPGTDRARIGRVVRASGSAARCRRSSISPRRRPTSSSR